MPILPFLQQHTGLWSMFFKSHGTWMNIRALTYRCCKKKATSAPVIGRSQGLAPKEGVSSVCTGSEVSHVPQFINPCIFCYLGTATLSLTGLSICSLPPKGLSSGCCWKEGEKQGMHCPAPLSAYPFQKFSFFLQGVHG